MVNPRCEYRDEPLGINTLTPRFSWQISARDRGFLQSAYELIVGDDRAAVAAVEQSSASRRIVHFFIVRFSFKD